MSSFLNLCLAAAIQTLPCEYVIDYGAEAVPFEYEVVLNFVTRDGDGLKDLQIEYGKNQDPAFCRDFLARALQNHEIATRSGPGNSLVIIGMAKGNKSPIKSVTLKSDKVIPIQVR